LLGVGTALVSSSVTNLLVQLGVPDVPANAPVFTVVSNAQMSVITVSNSVLILSKFVLIITRELSPFSVVAKDVIVAIVLDYRSSLCPIRACYWCFCCPT